MRRAEKQATSHPGARTANDGIGPEHRSAVSRVGDHPTISSLAEFLAEILAPQQESEESDVDLTLDSTSSVLEALFDSVESAQAGSESVIR